MNSNSDTIRSLFTWLLQDPSPTVSPSSSGKFLDSKTNSGELGTEDSMLDLWDPLDLENLSDLPPNLKALEHFSFQGAQPFELGDIPTVQDRFYTILKRRLQAEIEDNPPLFPWETEVMDYQAANSSLSEPKLIPASIWNANLQNLQWPNLLPTSVLATIFTHCQEVVQTSLQQGVKLVRAVEELFPENAYTLNNLAGMVLDYGIPGRGTQAPLADLPQSYAAATPEQQMALSLPA
ncbi:MAG: hypothetical protein F6K19_37850, partial [Cyanothece sp. SIO1E1]|nr:hypothetical protein [Cyanothece sp. SIO1E1]